MRPRGLAIGAVLAVALLGTGLWLAARSGAIEIGEFMSTGIDIEEKGPDGLPIIFWYIEREETAKIEALLEAGADIEIRGFQGATPLIYAAGADIWPIVLMLIERGAFIGAVDRRGFTLPWLAATTRVPETSERYPALQKVREILNERGLLGQYYEPNEVKRRIEAGTWPPR